jgi:polyisoprenoid-binding protein YceI
MLRYQLDPTQSRFTVQAFARGMLSAFGHSPTFAIRSFRGELSFAPEAPADNSFVLTIQANSLTLTDAVSAADRAEIEKQMRESVLETAANPEIAFQSAALKADRIAENWYRLQLDGTLQLHGVTKRHTVDAQLRIQDEGMRLSGQTTLLRSAFRIKPVSALAGTIKLKDELKFDFDLAGQKLDG